MGDISSKESKMKEHSALLSGEEKYSSLEHLANIVYVYQNRIKISFMVGKGSHGH